MTEKTNERPLAGIRVVEFAGIGPGPVAGMMLADLGAQVLLIERRDPADLGIARPRQFEIGHRGKTSLVLDLKDAGDRALALAIVSRADVVIEGFRPGTMERLGLGPEDCLKKNEKLIYGRITGYGQSGPLSPVAGHDLNYISLSGALYSIGRAGMPPTPPLNLVGDYAGGSMLLVNGILAALVQRSRSGRGEVVDAAMVEGAALLMGPHLGMLAAGLANTTRGENLLDSGAPFYDVYCCKDGQYIAFAAIEAKFRRVFAQRTGFDEQALLAPGTSQWPSLRTALARLFLERSRDQWCELLEDCDACVTPVLSPTEVAAHRHNAQRQTFCAPDGVLQPAPAPRFAHAGAAAVGTPPQPGQGGAATARAWGVSEESLGQLRT
jgi:alpha-methylacyl-CoA racemase